MNGGFPSGSCADAILSLDEADEDADRSLPVSPISGRDRKSREVRSRLTRESGALWTVRRVALWIVAPGPDGRKSG